MCVNVPQASTLEAWYTARITAPLSGGYYNFGAQPAVQLLNKSGMLWRIVGTRFAISCSMDSAISCQDVANPLAIQLSSINANGELSFPDPEIVVDSNPIPENIWKVAKDSNKPVYVKPIGRIVWDPSLAGFASITLYTQFQIQTITDSAFTEQFRKGCV